MIKSIVSKVRGGGNLPDKSNYYQMIVGFIGGLLGIGCIGILGTWQDAPLLMAPFGASCVLLFAAPDSPLAQPRNVIGGHLLSSLVGIVFLKYIGVSPIELGVAVGVAIVLMQLTRTLHAPAGADPILIIMMGNVGWSFLIIPVLMGSIVLVLIAVLVNNVGKRKWPKYW
ncbi:HPP family protein [Entomomonas asaccharolytica]|uniref:HPP family protein n=1 Tax=Entomomonas asaccharolytica TaxID=2785331 RepID=A0A974NH58_9GAMM|nr:HPP family protein [Entomomonas asaccharolytica]QQP86379.1 HPP family protein [Entomomonas asaccharolytica]